MVPMQVSRPEPRNDIEKIVGERQTNAMKYFSNTKSIQRIPFAPVGHSVAVEDENGRKAFTGGMTRTAPPSRNLTSSPKVRMLVPDFDLDFSKPDNSVALEVEPSPNPKSSRRTSTQSATAVEVSPPPPLPPSESEVEAEEEKPKKLKKKKSSRRSVVKPEPEPPLPPEPEPEPEEEKPRKKRKKSRRTIADDE